MVNVLYTKENDSYLPNVYFLSDDYKYMRKLKSIFSHPADPIYTKENITWYDRPYVNKFSAFEKKYWVNKIMFFPGAENVVINNESIKLLTDIINHKKNNNFYSFTYFNTINAALNDGKFDYISFGKLFLESAPNLGGN